jgi:hypothetical protein
MINILKNIPLIWEEHGFEIILGLCLAFILVFSLYRKITGQKGSWSSSYYYDVKHKKQQPFNTFNNKTQKKESRGETECRRVLEQLFKKPFANQRPDFLRNPVTGGKYNLELDCYNSGLKLAVEYHGAQHYKYIPFFHKNKESFYNQKYRDDMTRRKCQDNGVDLIEVPNTVKVNDIQDYIINELKKIGYIF